MPEKRNIYYLQLIVLKCVGVWTPFTSKDALYKRVLYTIWKMYTGSQCIIWATFEALLFICDYKTVHMDILTTTMAYLVQHTLGNAKMVVINYKRKDLDWLIAETEVAPFYREDDEDFKKNLRSSVKKSTKYTRLFWFFVFFTLNLAAVNAIVATVKNSYKMNADCKKKLELYEEKFSYFNETMPEILGKLKKYQRVHIIEEYVERNNIFEIDNETICEKAFKVLPFGGHIPYDSQKYYEITFLLQFTTFWTYATYICPLDLLIMCTMIHLGFQFNCLSKDLLSMREDCIKIVQERLGRTDIEKYEEIDEKILVDEIIIRLNTIILHHEHIFKYFFIAEDVYTWVLFAQYFGTSIMMCVMMYELAFSDVFTVKFLHICFFFAVIVFQLYINCYYGNDLFMESEYVATAAFQSGWEKSGKYSSKLRPHILMIMCRSLRPTKFSAGKFAFISLATFMTIGKTSYSYFTVMTNSRK